MSDKPDPVLDSEEFTKALTDVLLEEPGAYHCIVRLLFRGMSFEAIARELRIDKQTARKRCNRAKDIIRNYLGVHRPELLQSMIRETVEELTREEAEEVNRRFPFVDPAKIVS